MFMFNAAKCGGCERVFCCCQHRKEHQLACKLFKSKLHHSSSNSRMNLASGALNRLDSPLPVEARGELEDRYNRRKRQHEHLNIHLNYSRSSGSSSCSVVNRKYKKAIRGKFRKIQKVPLLESVKEEDEGEEEAKSGGNVPVILVNGLCEDRPTNSDAYSDFVVGSLKDSPITVIPSVLLRKDKDVLVTPSPSSGMGDDCNEIFKTSTPDGFPPQEYQPSKIPLSKLTFGCKLPHSIVNLKASTPKETEYGSGVSVNDGMVIEPRGVELKQEIDAGMTPMTKVQPVQCTPVDTHQSKQQSFIRSKSSGSKDKDMFVTPTASSGIGSDFNEIFKISTPNGFTSLDGQPSETPLLKLTFGCKLPNSVVNSKPSTPKETEYSSANTVNDGMVIESGGGELKREIDAGITPMTKVQPVLCTPADNEPPNQKRFIRSRSSSGSSGSSVYYSACSVISPLALNSHPCTPLTNPSLFTSVKDVFRTFISRLPGQRGDTKMEVFAPLDSSSIDSPARKRIRKTAVSRIQCRPTYKGRYKKPVSYVFNS